MFCSTCGVNNEGTAKFCHACGVSLSGAVAPPIPPDPGTMRGHAHRTQVIDRPRPTDKNPVLAAILSAVIVGVGQFYNGDVKKGATMLVGAVFLGAATAGVLWLAIAIWSAIDAYQVANGTGKMW
jgi:TM2 domain-containing membrane protein YozV